MEKVDITYFHKTLATYFAGKPLYLDEPTQKKPNVRKLVEQPWQQTKGELWNEVTNTLCNLDFIQAKACAKMTYELVHDFNAALEVVPDNQEAIRVEKARQVRMDKYTQDLIKCAGGEISIDDLEIPESITPWTKEQTGAEIDRVKSNPNRADKLKDFTYFLGQEAANLQNYANDFVYFSHQQAWNYAAEGPVGNAADILLLNRNTILLLRKQFNRPQWNPLPKVFKVLRGHTAWVNTVSITSDGKWAISGSNDNSCILWNMETGQAIKTLIGHTESVKTVSITPDGKRALSGSDDKTSILWDLQKGQAILTLSGHTERVETVSITPDGKRAISGSSDKTCILWDLISGEKLNVLLGHNSSVNTVAITADGKLALSGSTMDKTYILWNLENGLSIKEIPLKKFRKISITPDGKKGIALCGHNLCVLNLETGEIVKEIETYNDFAVLDVSITPDGKLGIIGTLDNTCVLFNLRTGKEIRNFNFHSDRVYAVCISPNGRWSVSGSIDNSCVIMDLEKGGQIVRNSFEPKNEIKALSITPDGKRVVSLSKYSCIIIDIVTGKKISDFSGHMGADYSVSIFPDGKMALSDRGSGLYLWDLKTCYNNTKYLEGHISQIYSVCISPDGKTAISGSSDNTCIIWNIKTGKILKMLSGHTSGIVEVTITPDGKTAITGSFDNSCIIWNLKSGKIVNILSKHSSEVMGVAITPDGKNAISGSLDNSFIIWNLRTGEEIKEVKMHLASAEWVRSFSITPDGKNVISVFNNMSCILWNIETGKNIARFVANCDVHSSVIGRKNVVLGCTGEVVFLDVNNDEMCQSISVTTIRQIWDFELQQYQPISADCPLCGHRFEPPVSVLATIEEITKKAGLKPDQSPCLELPDEAWEHPELLGVCPECGEKLKFNPFITGGD